MIRTIQALGLIAAADLGLSACTDGYGYSGVSVGYGAAPYYDDYYYDGYGTPYWGWYGDYYYPGTGYYVYDRYRRPYRWNDGQRNYWEQRRRAWRGDRGNGSPNWNGWRGDGRRAVAPPPASAAHGRRRRAAAPSLRRSASNGSSAAKPYRSGQTQQAQPRAPAPNRPGAGSGGGRHEGTATGAAAAGAGADRRDSSPRRLRPPGGGATARSRQSASPARRPG